MYLHGWYGHYSLFPGHVDVYRFLVQRNYMTFKDMFYMY